MSGIKLIAGLGNPGPQHSDNRHNVGFWWVDRLAALVKVFLRSEPKFHCSMARANHGPHEFWLLEPQTFMNLSGRAVGAVAKFYKIEPSEILIVHDELDFAPGVVKLKKGGGVAGHNGLKDIAAQLGSPDFWRLRIGIGHPGDRAAVANYVLSRPRMEEQALIDQAIERGLEVWPLIAAGNCEGAMLKLHTRNREESQ